MAHLRFLFDELDEGLPPCKSSRTSRDPSWTTNTVLPLAPPGTPLGSRGTPLGPLGTPLGPTRDVSGTPGTSLGLPGTSNDLVWITKTAISSQICSARSSRLPCSNLLVNPSPQGLPGTVLYIKRPPELKKRPPSPGISVRSLPLGQKLHLPVIY